MAKTVIYSVEGDNVQGNFDAGPGDSIILLGHSPSKIHAWRNGVDSCNLLGSPCPLQPMTGYSIPINEFAMGAYSIGKASPGAKPVLSNGELIVGSRPSLPPASERWRE